MVQTPTLATFIASYIHGDSLYLSFSKNQWSFGYSLGVSQLEAFTRRIPHVMCHDMVTSSEQ